MNKSRYYKYNQQPKRTHVYWQINYYIYNKKDVYCFIYYHNMAKRITKPENLQRKKNQLNAVVTGKNTASIPKEMRLKHTVAGQIKDVLGNLHNVDNDDRFISKASMPSLSDMEELLRQFRGGDLQNESENTSEKLSKKIFKTCNEAINFLVNEVGISKDRFKIVDEGTNWLSIDGNKSYSLVFKVNEWLKFTPPIIDYIAFHDIKTPLVNHKIFDTVLKNDGIPVLDITKVNLELNERVWVLIASWDRYYFKVTHGDESGRIYRVSGLINDKHLEFMFGKNRADLLNGETRYNTKEKENNRPQIMVVVEDNDVQDIDDPECWYY